MRNVLVLLMVCLVCGCAVKPKTAVTPPPVEVPTETALSKAAEEIQRDLLMLMGDRYADLEPNAVAALTATTSYRFTGELEDLVKDVAGAHKQIASKLGYKTKVVGSPVKVPVNIASGTRSWSEIIDLLNVKMKDAKFVVDDATETIILRYGN